MQFIRTKSPIRTPVPTEIEPEAVPQTSNALEELKKYSIICAESGDFDELITYYPRYISVGPSSILSSIKTGEDYKLFFESIASHVNERSRAKGKEAVVREIMQELFISWGLQSIKDIPHGHVSIPVDPRLSTLEEISQAAQCIASRFKEQAIKKEHLLVRIAGTKEGICAAKRLCAEGVLCDVTSCFSAAQVAAACNAGASVIRVNVGSSGVGVGEGGVQFVRETIQYVAEHKTCALVMAEGVTSFDDVLQLSGCDIISVSHELLKELARTEKGGCVCRKLHGSSMGMSPLAAGHREKLPADVEETWEMSSATRQLLDDARSREIRSAEQLQCLVEKFLEHEE